MTTRNVRGAVGFIFTPDLKQVLLIKKNRPDDLKGKWNGVGGKCEGAETFVDCMVRECWEETGLTIPAELWQQYATFQWQVWDAAVFCAIYTGPTTDATTKTDEEVAWHQVAELPSPIVSNIPWYVPMAINRITGPFPFMANIAYHE